MDACASAKARAVKGATLCVSVAPSAMMIRQESVSRLSTKAMSISSAAISEAVRVAE